MSMLVRCRKSTRWQSSRDGQKDLCLVVISRCSRSTMSNTSSKEQANPEVNDHYNSLFSSESPEVRALTKDEA
ncbi:hypothetical protein Tco_0000202 [Tanacetum coccineum]